MGVKSSISFGMVYIPVRLEVAVDEKEISFNQLEKNTMSRVRYQKTCDACEGRVVENKDIVKAYQYEKDRYVVFDDEDFEKIKTKKDRSITIEQFAHLTEIDPIFFDKPYYVVPTGAFKAYCLLLQAMESSGKVALARAVIGQKERLIALRADKGTLLLSTMYFSGQIRSAPALSINEQPTDQEQEIAALIIKSMTKPLDITAFKDEYFDKVMAAISAKIEGKQITAPVETSERLVDLMDALKASLKATNLAKSKQDSPSPQKKTKSAAKTTKSASKTAKKPLMIAKGR